MAAWFSTFLENPLVRRVNRRMPIRMVRFWRSTMDVEINAGSGLALDNAHFLRQHYWRTKAPARVRVVPIELDQHRVVHVLAERLLDGLNVGRMTVCGELDPVLQACGEIEQEGRRVGPVQSNESQAGTERSSRSARRYAPSGDAVADLPGDEAERWYSIASPG
jgi:hypothetical protein